MTADRLRSFHFSTDTQWNSCLLLEADGEALRAGGGIRPFAPYERSATTYPSNGAYAPAVTPAGDIIWHDGGGQLYRVSPCDDLPDVSPAPPAIGVATRIVAASSGLWVTGQAPEALQRYDGDTLTRILTVDLGDARVIDLADDGRGCVLALIERDRTFQSVRVDPAGHVVETIAFPDLSEPAAFAFLRRTQRFVVLARDGQQRVLWFSAQGGERLHAKEARLLVSRPTAALHPCFVADVLCSDRRDRTFVAGSDGDVFGGRPYVVVVDADGNTLGDVPIDPRDGPVTGVAVSRDALLVTGRRGLLRFGVASVVPDGAGQARCTLITPILSAPDREDGRRWLRIDATAALPEGSTLEIAFAASDDAVVRDRLKRVAEDAGVPVTQRVAALLDEPDIWHAPTVFQGSAAAADGAADPFSAKLFDTTDRYVWVRVTLTAAPRGALPGLTALDVRYPGQSLMESLPAIYQREEARPDSFLRSLVGVLEATTQGMDTRIAAMGSHLDPSTAPGEWLDFVARWLDVPWDDGLDIAQKRRILSRASTLAKGRGTRAGLEALLDSLMPGTPRRFRVTDATADFGFAVVAGRACAGSSLPAMLGGSTRWNAELDSRAVLGYMRLPCPNQPDDGVGQLAGRVRIDVAATGAERKAWEPWLAGLLADMMPVMARLQLRWVSPQALRSDRLDGTFTLDAPPTPHLGTNAITDVARLPDRGSRLSASGSSINTSLR